MRRSRLILAVGALLVLLGLALWPRPDDARGGPERLLGPLASVASNVTWLAAQEALRDGEPTRAVLAAERAVSLTPRDTLGWERYGALLGFELASPASELDPTVRLAWVRAALDVYARGAARADDPADLELARAVLLLSRAESDPELPWPDGPAEPLAHAAAALEAAAPEHAFAAALASEVRARARELRRAAGH